MQMVRWIASIVALSSHLGIATTSIPGTPVCDLLMGRPDWNDCLSLIDQLWIGWPGRPDHRGDGTISRVFYVPGISEIPEWATKSERELYVRRDLPIKAGFAQGESHSLSCGRQFWRN